MPGNVGLQEAGAQRLDILSMLRTPIDGALADTSNQTLQAIPAEELQRVQNLSVEEGTEWTMILQQQPEQERKRKYQWSHKFLTDHRRLLAEKIPFFKDASLALDEALTLASMPAEVAQTHNADMAERATPKEVASIFKRFQRMPSEDQQLVASIYPHVRTIQSSLQPPKDCSINSTEGRKELQQVITQAALQLQELRNTKGLTATPGLQAELSPNVTRARLGPLANQREALNALDVDGRHSDESASPHRNVSEKQNTNNRSGSGRIVISRLEEPQWAYNLQVPVTTVFAYSTESSHGPDAVVDLQEIMNHTGGQYTFPSVKVQNISFQMALHNLWNTDTEEPRGNILNDFIRVNPLTCPPASFQARHIILPPGTKNYLSSRTPLDGLVGYAISIGSQLFMVSRIKEWAKEQPTAEAAEEVGHFKHVMSGDGSGLESGVSSEPLPSSDTFLAGYDWKKAGFWGENGDEEHDKLPQIAVPKTEEELRVEKRELVRSAFITHQFPRWVPYGAKARNSAGAGLAGTTGSHAG